MRSAGTIPLGDLTVNHIDTAAFCPTYADESHAPHDSEALGWANDAIRRALTNCSTNPAPATPTTWPRT